MSIQNKTKGLLAIGERITKDEFQDYDIEFLATLGNEAMICLENARLFEETLEKQRMEEELVIAAEFKGEACISLVRRMTEESILETTVYGSKEAPKVFGDEGDEFVYAGNTSLVGHSRGTKRYEYLKEQLERYEKD